MEHAQRTTHEPSSSTNAYCSTLEELDVASYSVYTSAVEDAGESTSRRTWTTVDFSIDGDDEDYVRVLPGKTVRKYDMQEIKLLEKIGEGGQGTIYSAQLNSMDTATGEYKPNNSFLAAKVYKGRKFGEWPEVVFGLHSFSQYICKFHGYCHEKESYGQEESFCLLMTKYDCSLRDILDKQMKKGKFARHARPLPDFITLQMMFQIAMGMWFLHENNIIHKDLKSHNIFVTTSSSGVPLIAHIGDFDVASNVVGAVFWRAPEVLQALKEGKRPVFTPKADVYRYAMTCYEILTGGIPLEEVRFSDYDAVLVDGKRPKLPSYLNPKLRDFLSRCWHRDPEARPTFKEIVEQLKELH